MVRPGSVTSATLRPTNCSRNQREALASPQCRILSLTCPRFPAYIAGYWIHSFPDPSEPDDVNFLRGYSNPNEVDEFSTYADEFNMDYPRHYFELISGCNLDPPADKEVTTLPPLL